MQQEILFFFFFKKFEVYGKEDFPFPYREFDMLTKAVMLQQVPISL